MSDHEAERRAFWDAAFRALDQGRIPETSQISRYADLALAERDKRFPLVISGADITSTTTTFPLNREAPLVACPVCGQQPEWLDESIDGGIYQCAHRVPILERNIGTLFTRILGTEPAARAAWNSMRAAK